MRVGLAHLTPSSRLFGLHYLSTLYVVPEVSAMLRSYIRHIAVGATASVLACEGPRATTDSQGDTLSPLAERASPSRTIRVAAGQELHLTIGTVGPGEYASPPSVSAPVLQFLGMEFVGPFVPAGPQQEFRFRAAAPGLATISFHPLATTPRFRHDTGAVKGPSSTPCLAGRAKLF